MKTFIATLLLLGPLLAQAAMVGTNVPAEALTLARIASLPQDQKPAWWEYLDFSEKQMLQDQRVLREEMQNAGVKQPLTPPSQKSAQDLSLDQPAAWYGGAEALREAANIISFQTPAGGWSKNLNMTKQPRAPGEAYAPDNNNRFPSPGDFDAARDPHWHYVGTFDNDATITQMRFLAKVASAAGANGDAAKQAFLNGLTYCLRSQYPNGGWPQVWPLEGGYHDMITLNDGAMLHVLSLMRDVAQGSQDYGWVPEDQRARASASFELGLKCLLACQIRERDGRRTVWCQQHDPLTLAPASGRNYEMPSACSSESADVVLFLMRLPHADSNIVTAVRAAVAWFDRVRIMDQTYKSAGGAGRQLVATPGSGPTWARYYELGTDRPIFGDRDKTIHDQVSDLSLERRNGYGWYRNAPARVLEQYPLWNQANGH